MNRAKNKLDLFIGMKPISKQSARFRIAGNPGGKQWIDSYRDPKVEAWELSAKWWIKSRIQPKFKPIDGPLQIDEIIFIFDAPKNLLAAEKRIIQAGGFIFKYDKPDLGDNLKKPVYDAMNGIIYVDDSQIFYEGPCYKVYGMSPGISIKLSWQDYSTVNDFNPLTLDLLT
jgi:Holliday junction resolvase RusA-like endonuclease